MRKSWVVIMLTGLLLTMLSSVILASPAKKIGVLTLKNSTQYRQFGAVAANAITADLLRLKSCIVVERSELSRVFAEQNLEIKGYIDEASITELGGILGLDYLLTGSVEGNFVKERGHYYYDKKRKREQWVEGSKKSTVAITLKLIDVHNGQVVWSDRSSVTRYDDDMNGALTEAAYDSVRKLYQFIPLQGYVIKSEAGQYVIDLGTNHNVTVGDIFDVTSNRNTTVHPVTGELIVMQKKAGELVVTEVFDSICVAKPKDWAADIQPSDTVVKRLKKKPRGFMGLGWSGKHVF